MKRRVDVVLVVAASHALPVLLTSRILGHHTVFVESITRVDQLSLTGRLVRRMGLADWFFVQWPGLMQQFPGCLLGTLL